jgi:hypothetical protein
LFCALWLPSLRISVTSRSAMLQANGSGYRMQEMNSSRVTVPASASPAWPGTFRDIRDCLLRLIVITSPPCFDRGDRSQLGLDQRSINDCAAPAASTITMACADATAQILAGRLIAERR